MRRIKSFIILTGAATLVACATQAPTPAVAPAPKLIAAHTVSAYPNVPNDLKIPAGYMHSVAKDGTDVYCRNDTSPDSRAKRDIVCLTVAQLQAQQDNAASFQQGVQRSTAGFGSPYNSPPPPGGAYSGFH